MITCEVFQKIAASDARLRYDVQKAEAYQICLATELQQHFIPLIQQELNVDVLCDRLEACMKSAAQNTMPQVCKRNCCANISRGLIAVAEKPLVSKKLCTRTRIALQQKKMLLKRDFDL